MNAADLLAKAKAIGATVAADGGDLVLRSRVAIPEDLISDLRAHKAEVLALLVREDATRQSTTCRGCGVVILAGRTLCTNCGSAASPLFRYALELCSLVEQRTLRGRALIALDRRRYPQVRLSGGEKVGPGLISWCPVLRDAKPEKLREIIALAERTTTRTDDD
jgi:hypothetical protein